MKLKRRDHDDPYREEKRLARKPTLEETMSRIYDEIREREAKKARENPAPDYSGLSFEEALGAAYDDIQAREDKKAKLHKVMPSIGTSSDGDSGGDEFDPSRLVAQRSAPDRPMTVPVPTVAAMPPANPANRNQMPAQGPRPLPEMTWGAVPPEPWPTARPVGAEYFQPPSAPAPAPIGQDRFSQSLPPVATPTAPYDWRQHISDGASVPEQRHFPRVHGTNWAGLGPYGTVTGRDRFEWAGDAVFEGPQRQPESGSRHNGAVDAAAGASIRQPESVSLEQDGAGAAGGDAFQGPEVGFPKRRPAGVESMNPTFLNMLHYRESTVGGYGATNVSNDDVAAGLYQMTTAARIDAGLQTMEAKQDPWGHWTGKYGIESMDEFLDSAEAQELAFQEYMAKMYRYNRTAGNFDHIGQFVNGIVGRFQITEGGIMAAAHRHGAGGVAAYFQYMAANGWTTEIRTMPEKEVDRFREIETRMREFEDTPWIVTKPAIDIR